MSGDPATHAFRSFGFDRKTDRFGGPFDRGLKIALFPRVLEHLEKRYSPHEKMPLAGYAVTTAVFNTLLYGLVKSDRGDSLDSKDLLLAGIAIHKVARIITKDAVTSFLRAPFTRYIEPLGYGEVSEAPRQDGALGIVGEIVNCNYCMSAWMSLAAFWGLSRFRKKTRFLIGFFSAVAMSDFLHVIYEERRTSANVLTLQEEGLSKKKGAA